MRNINKFSDYHTKYSSTYLKTTEIKNNKSIKMQSTNCCIKHGSRNEHTSSYKKRDNSGLQLTCLHLQCLLKIFNLLKIRLNEIILGISHTLVTGFTEAYVLLQINKLISIKNININLDGFVLDGLDSLLDCTTHGCQPATQQTLVPILAFQ